jgi:hypothetical protein
MLLKTLAAEKLGAEDLVVVPRRDRRPVNWHRCRPVCGWLLRFGRRIGADHLDSPGCNEPGPGSSVASELAVARFGGTEDTQLRRPAQPLGHRYTAPCAISLRNANSAAARTFPRKASITTPHARLAPLRLRPIAPCSSNAISSIP